MGWCNEQDEPVRRVNEELRETREFYERDYRGIVGDGKYKNLNGEQSRHIRSEKDRHKDLGRR